MMDYIEVFSRQAVQMDSLISDSGFVKDINDGLYQGVLKASSLDGFSSLRLRICQGY